jgi:hypothetical protein
VVICVARQRLWVMQTFRRCGWGRAGSSELRIEPATQPLKRLENWGRPDQLFRQLSFRASADMIGVSGQSMTTSHRGHLANRQQQPKFGVDGLDVAHLGMPPLTYCGTERKRFQRGRGEGGYWADVERWQDSTGHSVGGELESPQMALYRFRAHLRELEDLDALARLDADMDRQRTEYAARFG